MGAEQLVKMFHDNTLYSFERTYERSFYTFGGPLDETISGQPTGPRPLHMLARLHMRYLPQVWDPFWTHCRRFDLPLVYGFNYDGCEIKYRLGISDIEILEMSPEESCDDVPYANYPLLLPYVPLKLSETRPCTFAEFAEEIPNKTGDQPADLIVVVPPLFTLGVSLWGSVGDTDCATVVFECNFADKTILAYNRCYS